ncbi:MAG: septal ring lytic transglycosylase RlpA family protein [Desulfobulbus oligotrophicus]|nr:septal ring lytic transglycosylase RlpA family protein [Desulfobulbus oligotrophicus]
MQLGVQKVSEALNVNRQPNLHQHAAVRVPSSSKTVAPSSVKTSIQLQSPVITGSSFQAFLAEQVTRQVAAEAGPRSSPSSQDTLNATTVPENQKEIVHIVQPGETVWKLAKKRYHVDPAVILQYNALTSPEKLQVGSKIRIPVEQSQITDSKGQEVVASWYGSCHHGRLMANGHPFNMHNATVAHRTLPMGTQVELENPKTGERAQAVVTDRGPYHRGRDIDLSYGLAKQLSLIRRGVGNLQMRVL